MQNLEYLVTELSGKNIAASLGVSDASVSKWRNGRTAFPDETKVFLSLMLGEKIIEAGEDGLIATTHTHQGSGNIHSMVAHNGLTLLPPDTDAEAGDIIDALWIR